MSFFENLFGKEKKVNYVKKEIAEKYFKLFSLFYEKDGTSDAKYLLKIMFQSPRDYYKDNDFALEMDGIKEDENIDNLVWNLFINILDECDIVSIVDPKSELDFFQYSMDKIDYKGIFDLHDERLDPDGNVTEWIKLLQTQAEAKGECIAEMEFDSDRYVFFLTDKDTLKEMRAIGLELDRYIKISELK